MAVATHSGRIAPTDNSAHLLATYYRMLAEITEIRRSHAASMAAARMKGTSGGHKRRTHSKKGSS